MTGLLGKARVQAGADQAGVTIEFAPRGEAHSLVQAAQNLGITPSEIVKTLVATAKRSQTTSERSWIIALIPGDKQVDWSKLRKLAGMKKLSMATPEEALAATGYSPGTITPFGAESTEGTRWPIYADASIAGRICMGAGEPGLNLFTDSAELFTAFDVTTADISRSHILENTGL